MIDPKLVKKWDIVFALQEKGCGYFATYEAVVIVPRPCTGGSSAYWTLASPCPDGCTSSPPPQLPTNPPCDPNYPDNGTENDIIGCCEGIVSVECSGTCCKCGGVECLTTETCCDDVCVNLQTDRDHCNSCTTPCNPDQDCCDGECKNIYEDSNNCNGCGNVCPEATPTCCNGDCCTTANCCFVDDILTCIDVTNNHDHCGRCDNPCAAEETCCSGECVNTQTDNEHCGSCPNACPVAFTCCSGVCKELFGDDRLNCGDCGKTCVVGEICKNGVCKDACAANDCEFTWVDPPGCCSRYVCSTENEYAFSSSYTSITDCSVDSPPNIPCDGSPESTGYFYLTWSPEPCCTGSCQSFCLEPTCTWSGPENSTCGEGCACQSFEGQPCACGTLRDDPCIRTVVPPGQWNATATCPQGCNCPGNAPIQNGTNGQVVSYECVNCLAPCEAGEKCCFGTCKNILTDPLNCGDCGNNCGDQILGNKCCNGKCVNILTGDLNCGDCTTVCPFPEVCCNGFCKNRNTDNYNCGSCGYECQTGIGETCCNGICVNENTDRNNCGSCGFTCPNADQCIDGNCVPCVPPCLEAGTACCNNQCIDILSDESNCGGCNIPCAGKCCGGICVLDLNTMFNCGDCGIECPQLINQINLWQCCNGQCKNLKTDPENCGFCGNVCQEPPGDTFTVPKCFLGNCAEPECDCQGYEAGMPPQPGPDDVAFVASCVGNTVSCDGSCYFNAVGGGWVLYEEPGGTGFSGTCGKEPDYTYCVDDKYACVDDKYVCVGDIYYCVKNIEGQDMPTYCIPAASFNAETQALIGSYIGAENCAAGCSGDGSECDPACGNGLTCCDTQCVDTQTDSANCGGCGGGPCAAGEACKDGVCTGCTPPCADGESCCEGGTTCCETCCADACCPTGQSCVDGVCATCEPPCTAGQTCCGGSCCDAGIICCDQTCCAEGEFCENGSCATCNPVCYPDETCCDATCVRWQCGECPNACASAEIVCCGLPGQEVCCPEGQTCVENACYGCTPPCSESQDCCDEVCTEVGTDTNCSGCGDACGEGTKCCDKVCTATGTDTNCSDCGDACAEGQSCCDDVCTEIGTDTNCSGCGDACTDGKCCEGVCKETQTDNENCGDCENVCNTAEGEKCVAGVCVTCDPPCTGLDVCCDLTCCKVCCGPEGSKTCCAEGKICLNGQCSGCEPECTEPGQTCCTNPNQPNPTEEEPSPPIGQCCPAGVLCCAGGCCPNENFYCCDNKVCCFNDRACCNGVCCAEGKFCNNGVCADCNPTCYSDEKCCPGTTGSGECIRWQCGDCPNACTRFQTCTNNVCCDAVTEGPLSGQTGVGCGTVCCDPGITCCRDICCLDPDEECCDGFCVNTNSIDNNNCGGCGQPCVAPATCCNGSCRTVFADTSSCGSCGNTCSLGMLCCPDNGGCVYPSYLNCGSCGNECEVGQSCCPDEQGGHTCLAQGSC